VKRVKMYAPWLVAGAIAGAVALQWQLAGFFLIGLLIGVAWVRFPIEREIKS